MNKLMIIIAAVLVLCLSAAAEHPRDMKFDLLKFNPPKPERFVTENGLIVYFLEDHSLPVISGTMMFHGGDAFDPKDKIGLASIGAAVMRSGGAGKRSPEQVDADLDFVSAGISSSSDAEALKMDFNCLKKDMSLTFEILADMVQKPLFDSTQTAVELSNRHDAVLRQNDDPGAVTRRIFYETVYTGHPYGNSITLASLDNIGRADLIAWHGKYYHSDNCILALSGNMTLAELNGILKQYFGGWKKGNVTIPPLNMAQMQYQPGVYYAERDINQAHLRFGHLNMDHKNPDRYAMEVLNFALGGSGFTSRLMKEVRTSAGLAYSVYSYNYIRPSGGVFFAFCQTRADAMGQALTMMQGIVDDIIAGGITDEELNLAKESIVNSFIFQYETPANIVEAQANLEFTGFPADQIEKDLAGYQAVTREDCARVAKKYLQPKDNVLVITGNKAMFDQPLENFGPVTNVSMEIK